MKTPLQGLLDWLPFLVFMAGKTIKSWFSSVLGLRGVNLLGYDSSGYIP
ncbi:MAG: hypothetical protein V7717_02690 [Porticoccaceae bacterium]